MDVQDWWGESLFSRDYREPGRASTLQARINSHLTQAATLQRQLEAVDQFGPDVYTDGAVITFKKQFQVKGVVYDYAMIRARGLWFSTGPKAPKAYTWDDMVLWLLSEPVPTTELWFATDFELVGQ